MAAFGDADVQQGRCSAARAAARSAGSWKPARAPLGLATRLLGLLEVDLGGQVGRLGHHHDLVGPDLEEAAGDGERFLVAALADAQLAHAQRGQQRRVVGQDAQLALDARAARPIRRRPRTRGVPA